MAEPFGVFVDAGGRLWVSEDVNNRAIRFDNAAGKANGASADGVLGQPNFTTNTYSTTQNGTGNVRGVWGDGRGRLYLVDEGNSRIMIFNNAASLANGANADNVLGQANFTTGTEAGTNGQHAYFQMLHQGTDVIPVEFIAVRTPCHGDVPAAVQAGLADQHRKLLANCLAQSQALMLGKSTAEALGETAPTASTALDAATLARHRTFPGNRPSTTLLIDRLTPAALGALIALYEHRIFTSGALWRINSFDQWGVELGKALCNQLLPRLDSGDASGLDGSTAALLRWARSG